MKKLKRISAQSHPLTEAERKEHQQIHDAMPHDAEILAQMNAVRKALSERQCEFEEVVHALKVARESRGLSLQDVCDRTGITRASLSLLENGHGNPTMTTLRRVAEAIGVEILVTVKG